MRTSKSVLVLVSLSSLLLMQTNAIAQKRIELARSKTTRDYPVKPVPFTAVHFNDAFWAPRIEINRASTIPFAFKKCEETKRINHFERAAAALKGELKDK